MQTTQPIAAEPLTKWQAAWQRFVDRVERGEQLDPAGQYVAKKTRVAATSGEQHATRPKFAAASIEFAEHYRMGSDGEIVGISPADVAAGKYPPPCNGCDPVPCDGNNGPCDGGGPTGPTITSTFVSSVGQGGTGPILDVKIIFNNPSESATELQDKAGYIMLNADLNKGAGGDYIYFAFSRNAQRQLPNEPDQYTPYGDAASIMRGFETKNRNGFFGSIPPPSSDFFNIWSIYQGGWARADLNSNAGGEYIYSYQSKNPNLINSANITEVGVLFGNSDTIQPPVGWIRYGADPNERCGGDYIYFCYKH